MNDILASIQAFNRGRDPERLAMKFRKMRTDPFVFLRGTCHLFYEHLPALDVLAKAPVTWVCGDLHLENFGSYKGDNRLAYFDINDFDEAALAPCTWDLIRFLTSIRLGADSLSINEAESDMLCRVFVDAYAAALATGKARWVERETACGLVRDLLVGLRERSRSAFLDTRTDIKGKRRHIRCDGLKALPASDAQRTRIEAFVRAFAGTQPNPAFFEVLDVARRVAGTGSLGVDRYIVLVEGKGSPAANYLLDIKQAIPSALVPHLPTTQPAWRSEAERVVTVQGRMQAIAMAFLHPVIIDGQCYILRGLQPSEDRVALKHWNGKLRRLEDVLTTMGQVVAWDQLRCSGRAGSAIADELIDFGQQTAWRKELLDGATQCAATTRSHWQAYAEAFDDGYFD
ncbi:MAG TPA: DUF2252 domain-containing protein [Rhodocyclaceae bacterium]|nr:DUF2252 domain-containing protein [Rhodocyclaceae bacterium]